MQRDAGTTPGLGKFPAVGNGNPLQYSCLEDSMDRGAWQTTVHGVAESDATQHLVCMGTFSYVILVNSYNNPMR